ncbi:tetratricopeptide repeat protein [Myxococcota bacterium]|nr:tetratricopeptide repeat protein [Myxococcota bacterium]MBU1379370.1 tetratricopeptide repeat protein [Myxococcota bacterium]MBU1497026.1 tetratricopeptide repeat protein [Myxococcota bacterium]
MKNSVLIFSFLSMILFSANAKAQGAACPKPSTTEENKKNAKIFFQIAKVHEGQKDFMKAKENLECVLSLIPYSAGARYRYAWVLDQLGQYSKAILQYRILLGNDDVKADPVYVKKINKRISEIENLKDVPLKTDKVEVKVDESAKKIDELKKELDELKKKQADQAKNKTADEIEKIKAEYKKLMELKQKQIDDALKTDKKPVDNNVNIKDPVTKPGKRYKTVISSKSKIGLSIVGFGILAGVLGVGSNIYSKMEWSSVQDASRDDKIQNAANTSYSRSTVLWEESKSKESYDNYKLFLNISIGLYVTAGIAAVAGAVLYYTGGGRRKVEVGGEVKEEKTAESIQILPLVLPDGGGIGISGSF